MDPSCPPGPKSSVPGRILLAFARDPIGMFTKIAQQYGDISYFRVGRRDVYFLNHPDLIKEVLVTKNQDYMKPPGLRRFKRVLGEGLLTSEGDFHSRQRRIMQPGFHSQSINRYGQIMAEYAVKGSGLWHDGEELDIHYEMMKLTLAIVGKTLFGTEVESEAREIGDAVTTGIEFVNRFGDLLPIVEKLPLPMSLRFKRALKLLDQTIHRIISERRSTDGEHEDLLSMLLGTLDVEGNREGMTDQQLRDEAMTLFLAGHETTANALTWAWYLLSQHPNAEQRLHAEIDSVLDGHFPKAEDVRKLRFTDMVLSEVMRLYPPAWSIGREAIRDTTVGAYAVPRRSIMVMSQYVTHRDPRYYVGPDSFNPDRWTPEWRAKLPSFAYFPFGGGPRGCIGQGFAWMEAMLILATIAGGWRFSLVPGQNVELAPRITLRPKHGIRMMAMRREVSPTKVAHASF